MSSGSDSFDCLLSEAHSCDALDLDFLLSRIETELEGLDPVPMVLLDAKRVVTARLASRNCSFLKDGN